MTPELLAALAGLLDRYGLPLALGLGLGWALLTRRITLGSETNYVEERRAEERTGRLAAEGSLRDMTLALATLTNAVEGIAENVESVATSVEALRAVIVDPRGRPLLTVTKPEAGRATRGQ